MKMTIQVKEVSWLDKSLIVTDAEDCRFNLGKPNFEVRVNATIVLEVDGRKLRGSDRSSAVEVSSASPATESSTQKPAPAQPTAPAGTRDNGK